MLSPLANPFRKRRGRGRRRTALTLVAAALDSDPVTGDWLLRLAFDGAVDTSGLAPGQITMDDAAGSGWVFVGTGIDSRPDPRTLVLTLALTDDPATGETRFTATPANGLAAADGGAWVGVVDCLLPYP
jgi:hypothetical protein